MESWQMNNLLLILGKIVRVYSYHGYIKSFIPQEALWAQGANINLHLRKRISRRKSPRATSEDVVLISQ